MKGRSGELPKQSRQVQGVGFFREGCVLHLGKERNKGKEREKGRNRVGYGHPCRTEWPV